MDHVVFINRLHVQNHNPPSEFNIKLCMTYIYIYIYYSFNMQNPFLSTICNYFQTTFFSPSIMAAG